MAKRLSNKAKMAMLDEFRKGNLSDEPIADLRAFLSDSNHMVVAEAAKVVEKYRYKELFPEMAVAFHRLVQGGLKADVGCIAKIAIVKAMDQLLYNDEDDVFHRGISYVQLEPAYGPPEDTAADLRARCAMALARLVHPKIFFLLTDLIMDPEPQARTGAVRSLVYLGTRESQLLLRMKILAGEAHPNVLSECFSGLVEIDAETSVTFFARLLDSNNGVIKEEAALALGETRLESAFELLCRSREEEILAERKQMYLLPIALTRRTQAFEYLIDLLENDHVKSALSALDALSIFQSDPSLRDRIQQVAENREEPVILQKLQEQRERLPY